MRIQIFFFETLEKTISWSEDREKIGQIKSKGFGRLNFSFWKRWWIFQKKFCFFFFFFFYFFNVVRGLRRGWWKSKTFKITWTYKLSPIYYRPTGVSSISYFNPQLHPFCFKIENWNLEEFSKLLYFLV